MGQLIQVTETVRIESGPARRKRVATEVDARPRGGPEVDKGKSGGTRGPFDAAGRKIVAGEEMEYLDWQGDHVWYVYKADEDGRYQRVGCEETMDKARTVAEGA